ncbi:hypothetical protein CCR75_008569 [Bremia lactucae]|uniref:FYVE-type domain-containing protein n=1 Tax=Bremia lactucae TaxID=4779 RepID=A0A976ICL8_BRELC|nr:hypothetical protein CCR75_008569 [Bremia lactucae]
MSRTAANKTTGHAPSSLMLERMHEAATDLVMLATTTQGWKFANERNNAMLYEMTGRNLPQNVTTAKKFGRGAGHSSDYYLVRAVTTVHAGVASLLDLLHSSTTDEFRLVMRQVFNQYFQNGVTLNRLTCTTPPPFAEDPDAGVDGSRRSFSEDDAYSVNWLTLKAQPKLGTVENHRDFTLVCYQDVFSRHESGVLERVGRGTARARSNTLNYQPQSRLVGAHVLSSVNFQDVPELPIPECTDRLHFRNSGFVIEETSEPNVMRLSLLLSLLPTKATLKYARKYQRWLQNLACCVGNLALVLRPEVTLHCMSKLSWKQSDHCFMCLKMFRTFRRRHHCRFCGEAVCSACSSMANMSGYEVKDGSGNALNESSALHLASSQSGGPNSTEFSQTGDVCTPTEGSRDSRYTRNFREARGCNTCVADLRHGLTASAVLRMRHNSGSGCHGNVEYVNYFSGDSSTLASSRNGRSASNCDEDSIVYDNFEDGNYERRLGTIATYIPSEGGPGALVEGNGLYSISTQGPAELADIFPVLSEELQDKFPSVDEVAPPRFRTVSDPDQLRRMRNVSDPEMPQRLKEKHSMVSMSTTSSSFSRSSNDKYLNDNASQYSRGTNYSAMSDGLSAGDLSRDPDILAIAGLSMKLRPSDDYEIASVRRRPMPYYYDFEPQVSHVLEDYDRERKAVINEENREDLDGRYHSNPWPGGTNAESQYRSDIATSRDGLVIPQSKSVSPVDVFRPADVLRHRSQTTGSLTWNSAATSLVKESDTKCNKVIDSSSRSTIGIGKLVGPNEASNSSSGSGHISTSKMTYRPHSVMPADVAAVTAISANITQLDHVKPRNNIETPLAARSGTAGHRLPPSIPEGPSTWGLDDLIPLTQPIQVPANFIVFSDSKRESIFTRADDGQDMIPLRL